MRARLLRDAGRPCAVARDVGPRAAATPLVPVRARLGLSRRPAGPRRGPRRRVSHVSDKPGMGLLEDVDLYAQLYRRMVLIRGFEDRVQRLFLRGEVYGPPH